ncbi:hypothetical protein U1Q18_045041 [Sarracenia purpurea var. burkii]
MTAHNGICSARDLRRNQGSGKSTAENQCRSCRGDFGGNFRRSFQNCQRRNSTKTEAQRNQRREVQEKKETISVPEVFLVFLIGDRSRRSGDWRRG